MKFVLYFATILMFCSSALAAENNTELVDKLLEGGAKLQEVANATLAKYNSFGDNVQELTFLSAKLDRVLVDMKSKIHIFGTHDLMKDFVSLEEEELMNIEDTMADVIPIIIDHSVHFKPNQSRHQESEASFFAKSIELSKELMEKYPFTKEYASAQMVLEQALNKLNDSKRLFPQGVVVAEEGQKWFATNEAIMQLMLEKASWRLPISAKAELPPAPEHVNMTQQLNIFTLLSTMKTSYQSKNHSCFQNLANLTKIGFEHLTSSYLYQTLLVESMLLHLTKELKNRSAHFPAHYVKVILEEDIHLGNELDKALELVNRQIESIGVIVESGRANETWTLDDVAGKVALLLRLTEGFNSEHRHLTEAPAMLMEIAALKKIDTVLANSNGTSNAEVIKIGQAVDLHERTIQHFTQSATWHSALLAGFVNL